MPNNQFLQFAIGGSANVESQTDYAADPLRTNGNQPGIAVSAFNNKAIRQATFVASALAQYMVNQTGLDVNDDGVQSNFLTTLGLALTSGFTYQSKTSAYNAAINDFVSCSSASFNVTLPTAIGSTGRQIVIKHGGTSLTQVYTLLTTSGQTIGGVASGSYALYTNGETLVLISDGANWQISGHKTGTAWVNSGLIGITAISGGNPTKGTTTQDKMLWRRDGTDVICQFFYIQSTAGTNGGGTYLFALPANITIDTTLFPAMTTAGQVANVIGTGAGGAPATNGGQMNIKLYDTTHVWCMINNNSSPGTYVEISNGFVGLGQAIAYSGTFRAPVVGWQP